MNDVAHDEKLVMALYRVAAKVTDTRERYNQVTMVHTSALPELSITFTGHSLGAAKALVSLSQFLHWQAKAADWRK